jgi:K+-sensing histidine kinase KdpD
MAVDDVLATVVEGEKASNLVRRIDQTLGRMASMLTNLLAPERIGAGAVRAEIGDFPTNDVLNRIKNEPVRSRVGPQSEQPLVPTAACR